MEGPQVGELGLRQGPKGLGATLELGLSSEGSEGPWEGFPWGITWSSSAPGTKISSS